MRAGSRYFWLALVLVVALGVVPLTGCTSDGGGTTEKADETKEPYRIGAVLSLSGTYAGLGEPEKNALELEVARINDAGGVGGHPIEIVYEDDATDPDTAVAATTRLVDKEGVLAIIGATGTGQTMAMRQEIDRAGIPQVSIAGGTVITSTFDPLVFQTPWSNAIVMPYTLSYMQKQGIAKIGLISDSGGFGADGAAMAKTAATAAGITIVAEETFNPGDTDMTSQLTKIKGTDAQAVLMVSAGKEAAIVAKNMMDLGMDVPIFGTHGNARKEFIEGAGPAAEGFKFAAGKVLIPELYGADSENFAVATDFIDRYTEKYGKAPDTFAGHAYDALYLIVNAMKTLDEGFDSAALRDAIEATDGFAGIGGTFTFSETDHNGMTANDLVMYEVTNNAWTEAK
ncbi:MAG: ABC transporter substrate-binding protein [Coriobacteriia bacterium]|nr:ABC transporter substrate-binding protein [Coriobacteriia bacterium]